MPLVIVKPTKMSNYKTFPISFPVTPSSYGSANNFTHLCDIFDFYQASAVVAIATRAHKKINADSAKMHAVLHDDHFLFYLVPSEARFLLGVLSNVCGFANFLKGRLRLQN